MRRKLIDAAVLTLVVLAAACGSDNQHLLTSKQLASHIIRAPSGYAIDPNPGSASNGQIDTQVFKEIGGSPSSSGFVAGFKQTYVNPSTGEGLAITVFEFKSRQEASAYFGTTAHETLTAADATYKPFPFIAGAVEADGTKEFGSEYARAVVLSTGRFYLQVLYATVAPAPTPLEFHVWVDVQHQQLASLR